MNDDRVELETLADRYYDAREARINAEDARSKVIWDHDAIVRTAVREERDAKYALHARLGMFEEAT